MRAVKSKVKIIYFLVIIIYSAFLMFPNVETDPIIDFYRLQQQYKWLTPELYYIIYNEVKKYNNIIIDDICAIIQYESGNYCNNNPQCMQTVRSYAGAVGYMQIMPFHHKGHWTDLYNPIINIKYGVRYYDWCLKYMRGNKQEALRCYNAGPASNKQHYVGWNTYVFPIIRKQNISINTYNPYCEIK